LKRSKRSFLTFTAIAIALLLSSFNVVVPVAAQTPLYTPCTEDKPTAVLTPAPVATAAATAAADAQAAATAGAEDFVFLRIIAAESQACYQSTETFAKGNFLNLPAGFNTAVGVTKSIDGEVAVDRANVANSKIGDITINISEFQSDNPRRDGIIRQRFLESNKYPLATLTNATLIGLPARAYKDGEKLTFQIKGILTVRDTKRETTFDATGSLTGDTLVISARTDVKMSDFGFSAPEIGGLVVTDDLMRIVVNLVAREQQDAATPAK
jgi:polyisoprenoid-binding protein YceI